MKKASEENEDGRGGVGNTKAATRVI